MCFSEAWEQSGRRRGSQGAVAPGRRSAASKMPKLAALMDEAEADVCAFMTFPKDHRPKIHSINPLKRLNGEIKRRTDVVGIFPNDAPDRRVAARTEPRMGGSARQIHEPGNDRAFER